MKREGDYQADWILCDASPLVHALEEDHLEAIIRGSSAIEIPFEYVREALQRAGVTAADSPDSFRRKLRGEYEALLDGAYAGWSEESNRLGIPLSLVILPRADRERQSPVIAELIRSLARRHGLDFFDLSAAFDGLEPGQFRVSAWDRHPSALGTAPSSMSYDPSSCVEARFRACRWGARRLIQVRVTCRSRSFPEDAQSFRERAVTGASACKSWSRSVRI